MKWNCIHLLILICVLLLTCNGLHADERCSPDDYPDQFPFYPEGECDDVTPLVWDHDNSVSILDVNSSGTIYVTGGTLPLTVQVSGQGFWLDPEHTIRYSVVNGRSIGIYADANACGSADITVTDGCGRVTGYVRSTDGRWEYVDTLNDANPCDGWPPDNTQIIGGLRYRLSREFISGSSGVSGYECANLYGVCAAPRGSCAGGSQTCLQQFWLSDLLRVAYGHPYPGAFVYSQACINNGWESVILVTNVRTHFDKWVCP